jgi:hypothetical protein
LATDEKQTRIYSFTLQYSLRNTALKGESLGTELFYGVRKW